MALSSNEKNSVILEATGLAESLVVATLNDDKEVYHLGNTFSRGEALEQLFIILHTASSEIDKNLIINRIIFDWMVNSKSKKLEL